RRRRDARRRRGHRPLPGGRPARAAVRRPGVAEGPGGAARAVRRAARVAELAQNWHRIVTHRARQTARLAEPDPVVPRGGWGFGMGPTQRHPAAAPAGVRPSRPSGVRPPPPHVAQSLRAMAEWAAASRARTGRYQPWEGLGRYEPIPYSRSASFSETLRSVDSLRWPM